MGFEFIIVLNVVRVQSHNKETVMYLKDQVKGLILTSVLMATLWSWKVIGWLSYYKDPTMDISNPAPLFHIYNGWFGVILFLTLGMWSKRFRLGFMAQAEEKKKMEEKKKAMIGDKAADTESTEDTQPLGSPEDGKSVHDDPDTAPDSPVSAHTRSGSRLGSGTSRPTSVTAVPPEEEESSDPVPEILKDDIDIP